MHMNPLSSWPKEIGLPMYNGEKYTIVLYRKVLLFFLSTPQQQNIERDNEFFKDKRPY